MSDTELFLRILELVTVDFYVCALPPILLCCLPCKKRAHFGGRLAGALLLVALSCVVCAWLYTFYFHFWFTNYSLILVYLLMMLGILLVESMLFQAPFSSLLFNLLGGFSVYQIGLFLFYIVHAAIPGISAIDSFSIIYTLVKYLWLAAAYVCAYFLIIRKQNQSYDSSISGRKHLLAFSGFLCLFLMIFNIVREGNVSRHTLLDAMCLICLILFYILILLFRGGLLKNIASEKELMLNKRVWEEKEKSLRMTQEAVNLINVKYHDLKHFTSRLQRGEDAAALAADLTSSLSTFEDTISTGNDTLDMVLTEHLIRCRQHGIRLTCMADGRCLFFISALDLISLFSNALENAYEAVLPLEETRREILLRVEQRLGMVMIRVENEFDASLELRNGLPQTTKQDRSYHGFGMKSIRQTVEAYGGDLQVEVENQRFLLKILIPVPKTVC